MRFFMIPIDLFDENRRKYEREITKYVNENLKIMVEVYIDYLNTDDGFEMSAKLEEVLPRDYVARKPDECKKIVYELYEMISSNVIRDYIKPKYEYLLYQIMCRWEEICDDEEEYIPIQLDTEFKESIINDFDKEVGDFIISQLEDFKNYYNFCFFDHDFLPQSLENMIKLYLESTRIMEVMFTDVSLGDYIDLMAVDLRELYLDKKHSEETMVKKLENEFIDLFTTVKKACLELQGNIIYKAASENQRNSFITSILGASGYHANEQTLRGQSNNGKAAGELDIFIRKDNGEPFSVIEAFKLSSLNKKYIDLHLTKIFKYDANGLENNVILVYSEANKFSQLCEKYFNYIKKIEYQHPLVNFFEDNNREYSEIRVGISKHLRNEKEVFLHHIIINLVS